MLKKIIYAALVCLAVTGCVNEEVHLDASEGANIMKEKEVLGLYTNGNDVLVYDKALHQYAFNTKHHTFRIQNAAQNRLVVCELSETPETGKAVEVEIVTKGLTNFKDTALEMEVLKVTDDKVWLYDDESKTGLVVVQ